MTKNGRLKFQTWSLTEDDHAVLVAHDDLTTYRVSPTLRGTMMMPIGLRTWSFTTMTFKVLNSPIRLPTGNPETRASPLWRTDWNYRQLNVHRRGTGDPFRLSGCHHLSTGNTMSM